MADLHSWLMALPVLLALGALTWLLSLRLRNVSIVDSVWSMMPASAALTYAWPWTGPLNSRRWVVLALVLIWAMRLSIYITARNAGHGEDRRYQEIRRRNDPGFAFKSLYLVFALQAVLAWIVSLSLLPALTRDPQWNAVDCVAAALTVFGLLWESIGDAQLARFKADPANRGRVMDRGLWRYSRHPNYFGECCVWWGFWLFAVAAGGWWAIVSPLLMTTLLLRVSGVSLLEKDIGERRPAYRDYIARTNAFFPWRPRS
jgi:steroid 5-alpha reductase family enzyme